MTKKKKLILVGLSVVLFAFLVSGNVLDQSLLALQENNKYKCKLDSYDRFGWKWSLTEVISTESDGESSICKALFDSDGNIHIVWVDFSDYDGSGTDSDIFYKRWNILTESWTTAEVVSTESTFDSSNPSFAIDSSGNIHVCWDDQTNYAGAGTDFDIFYKYRDALTSSWNDTELISHGSNLNSFTPSLGVDSAGNVHIVWRDPTNYVGSGTDDDIACRRWNATTSSWSLIEVVSTQSNLLSVAPDLYIDSNDKVHVAWHDYTDFGGAGADEDIFYKSWENPSTSWSNTEVVSTESTSDSRYASLIVDYVGNVHVIWHDTTDLTVSDAEYDIFYKYKDTLSSLWTTTEEVSIESVTGAAYYSSLSADNSGNIHVAWHDNTIYASSDSDIDIFYKRKDAVSSAWTTTDVISTESTGHSRYPSINVDNFGIVHAFWDDYTNYGGSGGDRDIFYKRLSGVPNSPDLAYIVPNPDEDGSVNIEWNDVYGADMYYVYRSSSYISSIDGLTPIHSTSTSSYIDSLPSTGFYYYVIVAENYVGLSALSNCQYIEYKIPSLSEFAITLGIIGGTTLILIVISNIRKKKKKIDI
jgi:hypothetical protein